MQPGGKNRCERLFLAGVGDTISQRVEVRNSFRNKEKQDIRAKEKCKDNRANCPRCVILITCLHVKTSRPVFHLLEKHREALCWSI